MCLQHQSWDCANHPNAKTLLSVLFSALSLKTFFYFSFVLLWLFLLVISVCAIICMFFGTLNFTFCSSSFYLNYFFLLILPFFPSSIFLLYSLNIWSTSSHSSLMLSLTFLCFLSSNLSYWSTCYFMSSCFTCSSLSYNSYNSFSRPTCVA